MKRLTKRGLQLYVRMAVASYTARQIPPATQPDTVVLTQVMEAVRERVLNQIQVPHAARSWSALVAGFGYCDQVNAAVARVAAHFFEAAQLYALYDPVHLTSPHTIGRVWSAARGGWLYFDATYDTPILFERSPSGVVHFIHAQAAAKPSRGPAPMELYQLSGWVMSDVRPTVVGQLRTTLVGMWGGGAVESAPPIVAAAPLEAAVIERAVTPRAPSAGVASPPPPHVFERIAAAYAAARLEHLVTGTPDRARYMAVATDPAAAADERASELAAAARLFATSQ